MLTLPNDIKSFLDSFQKKGYKIYVVGGPVRDMLLGKPITNWDFATDATPEKILKLFPEGFYNNQFGTVGISLQEGMLLEVTTFRKEGNYKDARHPDKIEWAKTIEEDLARRDFTINAMAYDGKKIVDLYRGQEDLAKKSIRAVGDPDKRFSEDALRLMRAIRLVLLFKRKHNLLLRYHGNVSVMSYLRS